MQTSLYNASGVLITRLVSEVLPSVDAIKIQNRLLDGSYHIQSIGGDILKIDIVCHVTESGKSVLDQCYSTDEPLKLVFYNSYYIGLIIDELKWEKSFKGDPIRRRYTARFTLIVSEEGMI